MKRTKFATALMIITAGSILYSELPARAGGIELDRVDITFKRNHDDAYGNDYGDEDYDRDYRRDMPPPPPPHHRGPRGHMPPPHRRPGGPGHGFHDRPGGHMPPPPHRGR